MTKMVCYPDYVIEENTQNQFQTVFSILIDKKKIEFSKLGTTNTGIIYLKTKIFGL
jgi:hypothetical protein